MKLNYPLQSNSSKVLFFKLFYQEPLSSVKTLTMLSLLHNAVVSKPNYRLFVIHKFPNLRVLDFKKVKERVTIFD